VGNPWAVWVIGDRDVPAGVGPTEVTEEAVVPEVALDALHRSGVMEPVDVIGFKQLARAARQNAVTMTRWRQTPICSNRTTPWLAALRT
jgi:hypothetical protein